MSRYFFDTYALVEIIKNNPNYVQYSDEVITTSLLNLIELYYSILKDFNEEKAKMVYSKFKESISEFSDDVIFEAMKFKLANKNLSYVDCIGYSFALKNGLKFLTGDKEFKESVNVEFVK